MIEFGNTEAVRAELVPLTPTFEFYRSILEFCQEPLEKGSALSVVRGDGVDDVVVWVAVTQYVKLWRLAAAVVRLAQLGQAYEAEALIRGMYETSLLIEFVLRRQVRPRENGKRIEHGHRPFSSKFRARMYIAHTAFRRASWARSAASTRGLRRQVPSSLGGYLEEEARPLHSMVGTFWAKRLHRHPTGLSVAALSETLGVKRLYESLYRARSASVHASDIERFVEESQGAVSIRLVPQTDVAQLLGESAALLLRGSYWVAKRLRLLNLETCKAHLARLDDVFGQGTSRSESDDKQAPSRPRASG
jgi:hypothetical protein